MALIRMKGEAEQALRESGVGHVIIQPSGFFSDMWEVFQLCRRGTFWSVGDGEMRFNPIALEDLGEFVARAVLDDTKAGTTLPVGGPDAIRMRELAEIASRILGRPVLVRAIPVGLARFGLSLVKPFSRNSWELGDFFVGQIEYARSRGADMLVPAFGTHHLEDYLRARYEAEGARS